MGDDQTPVVGDLTAQTHTEADLTLGYPLLDAAQAAYEAFHGPTPTHSAPWTEFVTFGFHEAWLRAAEAAVNVAKAPLLAERDRHTDLLDASLVRALGERDEARRDLSDARAALAELQETVAGIRLSENAAVHNLHFVLWLLAETRWRLDEEIRTNPGPTQWAYDQACTALRKHRARADAAETERDAARADVIGPQGTAHTDLDTVRRHTLGHRAGELNRPQDQT